MTKPMGVILAGGLASRMGGGDKTLLDLGGQTILDQVLSRISPQVGAMALNANGDPTRFARFGLPVVGDSVDGFAGPLAGVLAGMDWGADNGATSIVTVAADTPFFPQDLVVRLVKAASTSKQGIALAATRDPDRGISRHPTFGIWPVTLRNDLRVALKNGVRKVVQWTDEFGAATAMFEYKDMDPFFNVNAPEDLKRARELHLGQQS